MKKRWRLVESGESRCTFHVPIVDGMQKAKELKEGIS